MSELGTAPPPWFDVLFQRWMASGVTDTRPHALLLAGPMGIGKAALARAMVRQALCMHPQPEACGACDSCHKLSQGVHPDLYWLQRELDEKTGKQKRDIAIAQVRQLIERLRLTPHYRRGHCAVIEPVEALSASATNALLKTLEEPTPGTYLILVSHRPQSVLATIRSRCSIWRCAPPTEEAASQWLAAQGVDAGAVPWAIKTPLQVRAWADAEQLSLFARWEDCWKAIATGRLPPLAIVADIGREDIPLFIEWLTRWVHRSMQRAAAEDQGGRLTALDQIYGELIQAPGQLARNVNGTLIVESLALGWWRATAALRRA